MRRLIVSMNITLDGFMAGPDSGLDWHFRYWNEEMAEAAALELARADTLLLGRKTYEMMASYWPFQCGSFSFPRQDIPYAEMMNQYRKVVFSRTLRRVDWQNSELAAPGLTKTIGGLKKGSGKNLIVYGSASLLDGLMRHDLVDEYQLWVHPVVIGNGIPFIPYKKNRHALVMTAEHSFGSGVVMSSYSKSAGLCEG